jgi:uncharacterized membrane protein
MYTLRITNTGNCADTFAVAVSGDSWTTSAPSSVGPLAAGASEDVQIVVQVPISAGGGSSDIVSITVTSQGDGSVSDSSTLTTSANAVYGVEVTPPTAAQSGDPGSTVTYTLRITNTGNCADMFAVAVSGDSWTTSAPSSVGPLAAGASEDVQIVVQVPISAGGGSSDIVFITVTSQGDGSVSDSSTLTTSANAVYGVEVTPSTAAQSGDSGSTVTYTLRITNAGNAADMFVITVSGADWATDTPSSVGPLAAGAGADIQVVVYIPASAGGDASDEVVVTATSQGDGSKSAGAMLTTTISMRKIYLPLVLRNY